MINFSSRTTSMDVQRNIEAAVDKRTRNIYGPPAGKQLVIFIDDMNMPIVDTYGTQQPIAFLKLLIERGGLYDRDKELNWKQIIDTCNFVCFLDIRCVYRSLFLTHVWNDNFLQHTWPQWEKLEEVAMS